MTPSTSKQPIPSRTTVRRATVLTLALGLFLAGGGCGDGSDHLNLLDLPDGCEVHKTCGALVGVDCKSELDGPYYYVEGLTGRIVEVCGGACWRGGADGRCQQCPPKEWTCR